MHTYQATSPWLVGYRTGSGRAFQQIILQLYWCKSCQSVNVLLLFVIYHAVDISPQQHSPMLLKICEYAGQTTPFVAICLSCKCINLFFQHSHRSTIVFVYSIYLFISIYIPRSPLYLLLQTMLIGGRGGEVMTTSKFSLQHFCPKLICLLVLKEFAIQTVSLYDTFWQLISSLLEQVCGRPPTLAAQTDDPSCSFYSSFSHQGKRSESWQAAITVVRQEDFMFSYC